jgi:hypothetical protein
MAMDPQGRSQALLEQYKEFCKDSRHYDQKLWIIQSAAYTSSAFLYLAIFDGGKYPLSARLLLAVANVFIFAAFLIQYVKDRAFQLNLQQGIGRILEAIDGITNISQYTGELQGVARDRWFIRVLRRHSAANVVFYVMLILLFLHVSVAVYLMLRLKLR